MSKWELDGRLYDGLWDENGELVQLSRRDEPSKISLTLCFDNTSDGSAEEMILTGLKSRYLKRFSS